MLNRESKPAHRGAYFLRFFIAILCGLPVIQADAVHAQGRPYRNSNEEKLSKQDLDALEMATKELLDRPQLSNGAFEAWNNPNSGVSGTIVAGKALNRGGMACRQLTYYTTVPGPGPRSDRTTELTWCKTRDGWKIG